MAYLNRQYVQSRTQSLYEELVEHMDEHVKSLHEVVHKAAVENASKAVTRWMEENYRRLVPVAAA